MNRSDELMFFLEKGPKISVIVAVNEKDDDLDRCIDSILKQTYRNLEVIVVDRLSENKDSQIVRKYERREPRIKLIRCNKKQDIFQAKLSGVKAAKGEYVAFVDSNAYVSIDWFRTLALCAWKYNCDIAAGDTCFDDGGGELRVAALDPYQIKNWDLKKGEAFTEFMRQCGSAQSWQMICNKLYSRKLWENKLHALESVSERIEYIQPWEDIVCSIAMWAECKHFMNTHGALYCRTKQISSLMQKDENIVFRERKEREKRIWDAKEVMLFIKEQISSKMLDGAQQEKMESYSRRWFIHIGNVLYESMGGKEVRGLESEMRRILETDQKFEKEESFFDHIQTPVSNQFFWLNDCMESIMEAETRVVSFDVFDTLVKRSVLLPTDIFEILSSEMNTRYQMACVDFAAIRKNAEVRCRQIMRLNNPAWEDITLEEIYDCMRTECSIDEEKLNWAMKRETELELEFCVERRTGRLLYDLAVQAGKRIIICSDMYLPRTTIEEILNKNGFDRNEQIFVSSEYRVTKATGELYAAVCRELGIKDCKTIVHIGDNWFSDIEMAKKRNWRAFHFSKTEDLMFNRNPGVYTGNAINRVIWRNPQYIDMKVYEQFLGLRTMMGLMAAHCYDHPFIHTHPDSDYNADPERIGYMVLGPHILALCKWMEKIAVRERIPTIHFVARDGYLPKAAFDSLNTHPEIKTNYIRLSRKALLLADVQKPDDLYSIITKANVWSMTAEKLAGYLEPMIPEDKKERIREILGGKGILINKPFGDIEVFNLVIKAFIDEILDFSLLEDYQLQLKSYFSKIVKPGDYIFDVGYSGRPESALSSILGYPVGSLYIHTSNDMAIKRQHRYGYKAFCFYQHKPMISGVLREHLLMELGPSTVGYMEQNGEFLPVLEAYKEKYEVVLITQLVQEAALRFVKDYQRVFFKYQEAMEVRRDDASAWLEDYIHGARSIDEELFACVDFEDDFGLGESVKLIDIWRDERLRCCPIIAENNYNGNILADIYVDGYFIKLYHIINRLFPKGGKKREWMKKIASILMK